MPDVSVSQYVEQEASRLLDQKKQLDGIVNAQKRQLELNESYRKRYAKYIEMIIIVILTVLFYLAINVFQGLLPFIPSIVFNVAFVIISALFVVYMMNAMTELASRSTTNYDEIALPVKTPDSQTDKNASVTSGKISDLVAGQDSCIGQECCADGTVWDEATKRCVTAPAAPVRSPFATLADVPFRSLLTPSPTSGEIAPSDGQTALSFVMV